MDERKRLGSAHARSLARLLVWLSLQPEGGLLVNGWLITGAPGVRGLVHQIIVQKSPRR
jgi:hypothetical protein